ncbi:MAG: aminotransferase class V-fold PLP-dependent enzyme [Clostridia bacterium]|nr:aminotransferase class V-fold PLP-dependent enzyme [Clostridia bacterium]
MIYLDNAATTQPNMVALEHAQDYLTTRYYNPSALYREGYEVSGELKKARSALLSKVADETLFELVFTSGGTEADNQAVFAFAKRGNAVTTAGEHSAISAVFAELKNRGVVEPRIAPLERNGQVDVEKLLALIDEKTSFVSVMHVNNELGSINDVNTIAKLVKQKNPRVIFHSDGVQAYGKLPFKIAKEIDLYSISAHKLGGLKGIGGLIKRKSLALPAYIFGGGQELGRRSGTENVFGIQQFAFAAEEKFLTLKADFERIMRLRERLWDGLDQTIFQRLSPTDGTPYILNVSAVGLRGEVLLHMANDKGLLIGTGSACSSNSKTRYSKVVLACGYDERVADGVLRLSFSPKNTEEEIDEAIKILNEIGLDLKNRMK